MNDESGSALHKASFALLLLIAAALAYLIVRERIRSRDSANTQQAEVESLQLDSASAIVGSPAEIKSTLAPLRPRIETNSPRVVVAQNIVSPRNTVVVNRASSLDQTDTAAASAPSPSLPS